MAGIEPWPWMQHRWPGGFYPLEVYNPWVLEPRHVVRLTDDDKFHASWAEPIDEEIYRRLLPMIKREIRNQRRRRKDKKRNRNRRKSN